MLHPGPVQCHLLVIVPACIFIYNGDKLGQDFTRKTQVDSRIREKALGCLSNGHTMGEAARPARVLCPSQAHVRRNRVATFRRPGEASPIWRNYSPQQRTIYPQMRNEFVRFRSICDSSHASMLVARHPRKNEACSISSGVTRTDVAPWRLFPDVGDSRLDWGERRGIPQRFTRERP